MQTVEERFLSKVCKTEFCWVWVAGVRSKKTGYGAFRLGDDVIDAHRMSYLLFVGEIPNGLLVCHSCDNRKCVNPDHLFLGTTLDNMRDAKQKGRLKGIKRSPYIRKRKTSDQQLAEMRALSSQGVSYEEIAKRFSVDPRYVSRVVRGIWFKTIGVMAER